MTRNNALRGAAWLSVLIIANATTIGRMLENTAAELIIMVQTGQDVSVLQRLGTVAAHPEIETWAWWVTFVVLTLFANYLGNVFVGIWGDQPVAPVANPANVPSQAIVDDYHRNGEQAREPRAPGSLLTRRIQL